ncbi:MAG: putative toxin-antitoxin system toxin component, PIN family [Cyanobacteria bacterium]|nr:putative toxin-antitoxin system toxin component, PIN family [Cyanobacteriota bacterium]
MIIVADTNIIISALIKPFSDSSKILNLILSGKIKLAYDFRILNEYEEVLRRKKFNFEPKPIEDIINQIKEEGIHVNPAPLNETLLDKDDLPFLEIAVSSSADFIVTGNKKHFPKTHYKNIKILSPSEFLKEYKENI